MAPIMAAYGNRLQRLPGQVTYGRASPRCSQAFMCYPCAYGWAMSNLLIHAASDDDRKLQGFPPRAILTTARSPGS